MRRIAATFVVLEALAVASAWACSCVQEIDPNEYDVIFEGTVKKNAFGGGCGGETDTVFVVDVAVEGVSDGETVTVHHHKDNGKNCGVDFSKGEQWQVYAYEAQGVLWTDGCSVR